MKNLLFYLIPKRDITYLDNHDSYMTAYNTFKETSYTALPVINRRGKYIGTISEGDLLRTLMLSIEHPEIKLEDFRVGDIDFETKTIPARIDDSFEAILSLASRQNFVPLTDDQGIFIGILRRQELILELLEMLNTCENQENA